MTIEFTVAGRRRRAPLWLPPGYDPARRWPLVVFLHAYEERGDDFEHLGVGIGPALDEHPELYSCIVLLPQCPRDLVWAVVDRPWAEGCGSAESHLDACIGAACARYPIDPARIALTGASMGGYGTFVYGARRAALFRAFGPVCGGGIPAEAAPLADAPVWIVHGTADDVVPVAESRVMVEAIRAHGGRGSLEFTEIDGAGHDVWNLAYRDPRFAAFLVGARRS